MQPRSRVRRASAAPSRDPSAPNWAWLSPHRISHAGWLRPTSNLLWAARAIPDDNALAEMINGLYKAELSHRRAPWTTSESVEVATLELVSWFNHHRLLEPIGYIPPAEAEATTTGDSPVMTPRWWTDLNRLASTDAGGDSWSVMMYHYTECGLDNVWLENRYKIHRTPYGKGMSVVDADGLDQAIAICLTKKPGRMTGKEFRFLRTLLGLAQHNLADMVGVTEQSVSLWERTGKVPKQGDAAVRLLLEKFDGDGTWSKMIERIKSVDRLVIQQIVFREQRHNWVGKPQAEKPAEVEFA